MTKYRVGGIDCAVCAQGVEEGLRKIEGVSTVALDFATLTLQVEALDLDAVEQEAKRLEPGIGLWRIDGTIGEFETAATDPTHRRDFLIAGAAGFLALAWYLIEARLGRGGGFPSWFLPLPYLAAWLLAGWPVLRGAAANMLRGRVFDELFLMSIATIGALLISQYEEAVGVMVFYRIGETLQAMAVDRSRRSLKALLDLRPATVRLRQGDDWVVVPASQLAGGDRFLVLPGEALPADGLVEAGEALVDTKSLTGEGAPRDAAPGTELLGGFIAIDGALELRALRPAAESQAAKIVGLVEGASARKAKTEKAVTRFARWYTPLVVAIAAVTAFLPPLLVPGATFEVWIYRALVMLVISCPCALVISIPLGYFAGLGGAARRGILIRGGEALEALARVGGVVFDKTGTLTEGSFEVLSIEAAEGHSADEVLGLAAACEERSNHLIAIALMQAATERGLSAPTGSVEAFREFPGRGVVATRDGRRLLVGNRRLIEEDAPDLPLAAVGDFGTAVYVATESALVGTIRIGDRTRVEAPAALAELRQLGVARFVILSGDGYGPTAALARELGIAELEAPLSPEGKLLALEALLAGAGAGSEASRGCLMFVGDGTNDAPVIARADVGVAMGAGSDAAVETADVVLVGHGLTRVGEAIRHARRTRRIVRQNMVFAIATKAAFLALGAAGLAGMWLAVIADVGVAIVAVLNASRALGSRSG